MIKNRRAFIIGIKSTILSKKEKYGGEAQKLFDDGKRLLNRIVTKKLLIAKGIIGIHSANSKNESVITKEETLDWQVMKPALLGAIMDHYSSGEEVIYKDKEEIKKELEFYQIIFLIFQVFQSGVEVG